MIEDRDVYAAVGPASKNLRDLAKLDGVKVGLFRTRLTITLILAVHFFAYIFIEGPHGYLSGFKYYPIT